MTTTPRLLVTELEAQQANAHVTVNTGTRALEQFANLIAVIDRGLVAEPGSPSDGDAYLLTTTPTGTNWSGHGDELAFYASGWYFVPPLEGMVVYVKDEDVLLFYDGTSWLGEVQTVRQSILTPGSAEDRTLWKPNKAVRILEMNAVLRGSSTPSVTWTVRHAADRSATGTEVVTGGTTTTSVTTGSDVTSFNAADVVADAWVWLETSAQSGTVDELGLSVLYQLR